MNSNELFAREKKAAKLAAVLLKCGATEEDVLNATPEQWAMAAEAAGCHPPHSQATIDLVLKFMQKEVIEEQTSDVRAEGGFGSPFVNYKTAAEEADEAAAANQAEADAEEKAEAQWLENQMSETGADRCPPRE
jgi:hypothetical protein